MICNLNYKLSHVNAGALPCFSFKEAILIYISAQNHINLMFLLAADDIV